MEEMEGLFPVFDVPEVEEEEFDTEYKRSVKWDVDAGDFVREGSGRIAECDGMEAYMIWCYKASQTERYECLAYPDEIGVEMESATHDDDPKTVESMVRRTVTEALMANPRTESVENFSFSWEGGFMTGSCDVIGVGMEEAFHLLF